jgi:hypothetical protein
MTKPARARLRRRHAIVALGPASLALFAGVALGSRRDRGAEVLPELRSSTVEADD